MATRRGFPTRLGGACLITVVCLAWVGCSGPERIAGDPLLGRSAGVTAAPKPNQTAGIAPVPAVPPLPASTTAGSTAALAAGAASTFDGRHNLQIDDTTRPVASNPGWTNPTAGGAVLQRPVPIPGQAAPPASATPAPGNVALVSGPKVTSYEQAQAQLTARGVLWQRLEAVANQQWKFTCAVPNPQNKQISRVYEAQAASGLEAIQAILEQIDKDRL
jgi:hypothetical protein